MAAFLDTLALNLARLGPVGLSPVAPGTAASAAAAALAPWLFLPLPLAGRLLLLALIAGVGVWAATRAEVLLNRKDPSSVVIDELAGQWLTLLLISLSPKALIVPGPVLGPANAPLLLLVAGFALFRVFDIFKPGPIRASEKWLKAGGGIMIDDLLAGVCALICLRALNMAWGI